MSKPANVDLSGASAKRAEPGRVGLRRTVLASGPVAMVVALTAFAPSPARAVDGCLVLLCFAAPSWRAIPQCIPPIRQVLRDLALGRVFPTCGMAGGASSASHTWSSAPGFCPPQYTRSYEGESGPVYSCDYIGAVSVSVNGEAFARTWWSMAGDTVTDFSSSAKTQLGSWNTRFDDDYAAWRGALPPPTPPAPPIKSGA